MSGFSRTNTINQFSLMSCECTDRLFGYLASVVLCLFVVTLPLFEVVASLCLFAAVLHLLVVVLCLFVVILRLFLVGMCLFK